MSRDTATDPLAVLVTGSDSYAAHLQPSGELHDPVYLVPTQYGTAYYAHVNAVLSVVGPQGRRAEFADRALRGLDAALRHTENLELPPTASGFTRDTGSIRSSGSHRDFTWPPILKAYRILRDAGNDLDEIARRISAVDPEAAFRSRPPSNWASVWLSGEWIRVTEKLSSNAVAEIDTWLDGFAPRLHVEQGYFEEPGRPNSYDLFTRFHLADMLQEGYDGAQADNLRRLMETGLQRSFAVQMSDGSMASAHRSCGQSWTDGVQVAYFTHAANYFADIDKELAAAARAGAQRALESLVRWQRAGGPFSPVHNVLPPTRRVGYEGYTADGHYGNLALSFLASAVFHGFRGDSADLSKRTVFSRLEQEPTWRGVAHEGRISVAVNGAPAPDYDGFGITDMTFGAGRILQFSSSARHLQTRKFFNLGLGVRSGPGRSRTDIVADRTHELTGPIAGDERSIAVRSRTVAETVVNIELPSYDYALRVELIADGVQVSEETPELTGYKTVLVPYLRDNGNGVETTVEPVSDGVVLRHGEEEVRVVVDGAIDSILDLPDNYENRRGLCGVVRIDLAEPSVGVRYRVISSR